MSLVIDLHVEPAGQPVGRMIIGRLEWLDLSDKAAIADRVCEYMVLVDKKTIGTVKHRYGDGAWVLLGKAIALLSDTEGNG